MTRLTPSASSTIGTSCPPGLAPKPRSGRHETHGTREGT